jgi:hypothetical protein
MNQLYKKINICCYALIHNEKIEICTKLLDIFKNKYKFNPKIFTIEFGRTSFNAIKKIFSSCIVIKYFFHSFSLNI